MSKFDYLGLDGRTLRTFLTVLEEKSVSRAAERLGVSQSAVSHTLDKLRSIFDDPLFIRIGRGIESTARARVMRVPIESVTGKLYGGVGIIQLPMLKCQNIGFLNDTILNIDRVTNGLIFMPTFRSARNRRQMNNQRSGYGS